MTRGAASLGDRNAGELDACLTRLLTHIRGPMAAALGAGLGKSPGESTSAGSNKGALAEGVINYWPGVLLRLGCLPLRVRPCPVGVASALLGWLPSDPTDDGG